MIGTATSAAAEDRTRRKEDSSDAVVAPSTQSRRICRSNARREDCVMARKPPKQQRTEGAQWRERYRVGGNSEIPIPIPIKTTHLKNSPCARVCDVVK
jgi:hypothetical protein